MTRALAVAAALVLPGCFTLHYVTNRPQQDQPAPEMWHHNVIQGLVEVSPPVFVDDICPNGFAKVDNQVTFLDWLITTIVNEIVNAAIGLGIGRAFPTVFPPLVTSGPTTPGTVFLTALSSPNVDVTWWTISSVWVTCAAKPPRAARVKSHSPPPVFRATQTA